MLYYFKNMKKYFFIISLLLFLIIPFGVNASDPCSGLVPCGPGCDPCTLCDIFVLFGRIIDLLLVGYGGSPPIVPLIAVFMIMLAGVVMIVSYISPFDGGGADALNKAKAIFRAVIWGLILTYGAWIIVNFLAERILGDDPEDPDRRWYEICGEQQNRSFSLK